MLDAEISEQNVHVVFFAAGCPKGCTTWTYAPKPHAVVIRTWVLRARRNRRASRMPSSAPNPKLCNRNVARGEQCRGYCIAAYFQTIPSHSGHHWVTADGLTTSSNLVNARDGMKTRNTSTARRCWPSRGKTPCLWFVH